MVLDTANTSLVVFLDSFLFTHTHTDPLTISYMQIYQRLCVFKTLPPSLAQTGKWNAQHTKHLFNATIVLQVQLLPATHMLHVCKQFLDLVLVARTM